ncbi:MAG: pyridoxal-phosphate dependent enzyme [Saprospiraceae bacterium]|nr:pyridoxal-phosphate dependent enzyme [Saprospiraceae bacterium]
MFESTIASPLQKIKDNRLEARGITLLIKRDDLMHGPCQGNKFRKLKYHLIECRRQLSDHMVTFGGAFSNHLFATAAAGYHFKIKTTGIIRGEIDEANPTIMKLKAWKMHLECIHRHDYQKKDSEQFLTMIKQRYPDAYLIPEGGHHTLAQQGVGEIVDEVKDQYHQNIDHWFCPVGTGSTILGIAKKISRGSVAGFVVLKGFNLEDTKSKMCTEHDLPENKIQLIDAHFGGYGRKNEMVERFIHEFYADHDIILDPIYTGKMFLSLFNLLTTSAHYEGSTIVAIHTGGLQGNSGYNYRYGSALPEWTPGAC